MFCSGKLKVSRDLVISLHVLRKNVSGIRYNSSLDHTLVLHEGKLPELRFTSLMLKTPEPEKKVDGPG